MTGANASERTLRRSIPRRSMRCPPAIDRQRNACDGSRGFGGEEHHERAELLNGRKALIWLLREQHIADHLLARDVVSLGLAVDLRLDQRRVDITGADRVAGYALFSGFQ